MSCYIRHLSSVLGENGISVTKENRKEIDRAIHEFVSVAYKDCPETWRLVKKDIRDNPKELRRLVAYLRTRITER